MRKNHNRQVFFSLLRAGLWENSVNFTGDSLKFTGCLDWEEVYKLAEEQSVQGLVLAGIDCLPNEQKPPKVLLLQWIGEIQMLEQQNQSMNQFIGELVVKMRKADISTLLIKGQGVAQCYERPLWRSCGDVDFFLSEDNYKKALNCLTPLSQSVDQELHGEPHIAMHIDPWIVELHAGIPTRLISRIDKVLEKLTYNTFYGGEVRSWENGKALVFLPYPDNDVLFVFTHILKHFYRGGIGLRQMCDWCRLLWTYRDSINYQLLEARIKEMGLMTEWKAFAALAVKWLGMPKEAMPLYNANDNHNVQRLERKADHIVDFVLETGNFGHNRDTSYYNNRPYVIRKMLSLKQHTIDGIHHFKVFPLDSIRIWGRMLRSGIKAAIDRR